LYHRVVEREYNRNRRASRTTFETLLGVLTVLASGLPDNVSDQFQVVPEGTDHKQAYRYIITGRPFWQTLLSFFSFSSFFK
jgi:hypothetical protein